MKHARADYNRIQDPAKEIGEEEPVFLLRAKDRCAPGAIEEWCKIAASIGVDKKMIDAARQQAFLMRRWQIKNGSKVPDMPQQPGWDGPDAE